ncbi:MAG: hypothetical protein AAFZ87_04810 [Planctomycetota bacterium]
MRTTILTSLGAVALGAVVVAAGPLGQERKSSDPVNPGDVIDYDFAQSPLNSLGIKSFSELRGRPVLVEFWGTR